MSLNLTFQVAYSITFHKKVELSGRLPAFQHQLCKTCWQNCEQSAQYGSQRSPQHLAHFLITFFLHIFQQLRQIKSIENEIPDSSLVKPNI